MRVVSKCMSSKLKILAQTLPLLVKSCMSSASEMMFNSESPWQRSPVIESFRICRHAPLYVIAHLVYMMSCYRGDTYTGWSCCDCSKTGNHDNQTSKNNKKFSGRTQNAAGVPKSTDTWIPSSYSSINYSFQTLQNPLWKSIPIFKRTINFLSNFQNLGYHQLGNPQDFDFDHIK